MERSERMEMSRTDKTAIESRTALTTSRNTDHGKTQAPTKNTDTGMAPTTSRNADMDKTTEIETITDKTLNVNVELIGEDKVSMMELLNAVKETCGRVIGCRIKGQKRYELTMNNRKGKERLLDGFKIRSTKIMAKEVARDELVVSFLNLPTYIQDEGILAKLAMWGVSATSPIKRRKWAGTDIVDGTRFCRVKFNETVQSLPYSTKFETLEGTEYFRVIHDNQVKVCRLCIQPGHILRDCPEFKCHKCNQIGHYARECQGKTEICEGCTRRKERCTCEQEEETCSMSEKEDGEEEEMSDAPISCAQRSLPVAREVDAQQRDLPVAWKEDVQQRVLPVAWKADAGSEAEGEAKKQTTTMGRGPEAEREESAFREPAAPGPRGRGQRASLSKKKTQQGRGTSETAELDSQDPRMVEESAGTGESTDNDMTTEGDDTDFMEVVAGRKRLGRWKDTKREVKGRKERL